MVEIAKTDGETHAISPTKTGTGGGGSGLSWKKLRGGAWAESFAAPDLQFVIMTIRR